ncbi:MAG: dTDP-glucose 4,6-dehydratase [Planctomycetes bacterium]|nr:dTDP-glucose 4,6-dehydratase [Planctomycetota bacterium]
MFQVLVTGGCGFIGSNFVRHLLTTRNDVVVTNLDKLTYAGNPQNLADVADKPRYQFIEGDIADAKIVRVAARKKDAIFNFAAESHVDRSIHDSTVFVRTNVLGTQVLLDAAREMHVSRYIQISTDEVYGSLGPTGYFTEESRIAPNSPYSASKAAADLLVQSYIHTFGLNANITRCSNNYGPWQFPEKLIPLFITNLLRDQAVPIYGLGRNIRDWIHVLDHCTAIEAVWREGKPGATYNIGGECELTNMQVTEKLLAILAKPHSLICHVVDRPGHDARYAIDCSKIKSELGWRPQIHFDKGLHETVRWYAEHSRWVEEIRNGEYRNYYQKQYGQVA